MKPTAHAWHPSACLWVYRCAAHFFFVASDEKSRQKIFSFRFITLHSFNRTGFNAFAHGTAKKWQKINKNRSASFFAEPSFPKHIPKALNPASFIRSSPLRYTSNIFCHAFRARLLSVIPFVPHFIPYSKQSHTKKKCLHAGMATVDPAGGRCGHALVFCPPPLVGLPPPRPHAVGLPGGADASHR